MRKTILLPSKVVTNREGYDYFAFLSDSMIDINADELCFDCAECVTFDANLAAVLGALLGDYMRKGHKVFMRNMMAGVERALSRNSFLISIEEEAKYEDEKEQYVRYRAFPSSIASDEGFKEYINTWLINKKCFPIHTHQVGDKIKESIYEIYVNAMMHGQSNFVHCCGEVELRNNRLKMTIVDTGRTILTNVNEFLKSQCQDALDACSAILWAIEDGHTTKNHPGGLGLSILKDFISQNNGSMQIVSADGMITYRNNNFYRDELCNVFPGTIVTLEFNLNDDKVYYTDATGSIDYASLL